MPMCATIPETPVVPPPQWVDVRDPAHPSRLLCRYDPARHLIEIVIRGEKQLIDLTAYRPPPETA